MSEQSRDVRAWKRLSSWRAQTSLLDDADVRAVLDELMAGTEFDVLLTGASGHAELYAGLRDRAIDVLLSQGRDRDQRDLVARYVGEDLRMRLPVLSPEYDERLRAFAALGYVRVPPLTNHRDLETLSHRTIGWSGSGADHRALETRGIPARIELERYRGFVSIAVQSWTPGVAGDRTRPDRFESRRAMLDSAGELVALDVDALAPEHLREDIRAELLRLALAFRDWQVSRDQAAYQVSMDLSHQGREPLPPARS